jgi:hypothetical protein
VVELEEPLVHNTQLMAKTAHLEMPLQQAEEPGLVAVTAADSLPLVGVAVPAEVLQKKVVAIMAGRGPEHQAVLRSTKTLRAVGCRMAIPVGISGQSILSLAPVVVEPVPPADLSQIAPDHGIGSPAAAETASGLKLPAPGKCTRVEAAEPPRHLEMVVLAV